MAKEINTITFDQYLQLLGLLTLSIDYKRKFEELIDVAGEKLYEYVDSENRWEVEDFRNRFFDAVFEEDDLIKTLSHLNIEVTKKIAPKT